MVGSNYDCPFSRDPKCFHWGFYLLMVIQIPCVLNPLRLRVCSYLIWFIFLNRYTLYFFSKSHLVELLGRRLYGFDNLSFNWFIERFLSSLSSKYFIWRNLGLI